MADQCKYLSKLKGSKVLILGGSAGVGLAVAEAVIEHGGSVVIASHNPDRLEKGLKSLETDYPSTVGTGRVSGYPIDLGNEATMEQDIIDLFEKSGPFNHIVYTAGEQNGRMTINDATLDLVKNAGTIRYVAPIFVAKHAPKYLINKNGEDCSITLSSSVSAQKPLPGWSPIAGMRSAVFGLGMSLAFDLRPIRVNVIAVGPVDTGLWSIHPEKKMIFDKLKNGKSATGRIAVPQDVAEAYIYCMKDANVTGSVINTNSGVLLM